MHYYLAACENYYPGNPTGVTGFVFDMGAYVYMGDTVMTGRDSHLKIV